MLREGIRYRGRRMLFIRSIRDARTKKVSAAPIVIEKLRRSCKLRRTGFVMEQRPEPRNGPAIVELSFPGNQLDKISARVKDTNNSPLSFTFPGFTVYDVRNVSLTAGSVPSFGDLNAKLFQYSISIELMQTQRVTNHFRCILKIAAFKLSGNVFLLFFSETDVHKATLKTKLQWCPFFGRIGHK